MRLIQQSLSTSKKKQEKLRNKFGKTDWNSWLWETSNSLRVIDQESSDNGWKIVDLDLLD